MYYSLHCRMLKRLWRSRPDCCRSNCGKNQVADEEKNKIKKEEPVDVKRSKKFLKRQYLKPSLGDFTLPEYTEKVIIYGFLMVYSYFSFRIFKQVVNPFSNKPCFLHVYSTSLLKTLEKGEIVCNKQFLLFSQSFFTNLENFLPFSSSLKLSSANSFSLNVSLIIPPKTLFGGYIGVSLSVGRSVRPSVGL